MNGMSEYTVYGVATTINYIVLAFYTKYTFQWKDIMYGNHGEWFIRPWYIGDLLN